MVGSQVSRLLLNLNEGNDDFRGTSKEVREMQTNDPKYLVYNEAAFDERRRDW